MKTASTIFAGVALFSVFFLGCYGKEFPSEPSKPHLMAGQWEIVMDKALKIENTYEYVALLELAESDDPANNHNRINGSMTIGAISVPMSGFAHYLFYAGLDIAGSYHSTQYSISASAMREDGDINSLRGHMNVSDYSVSPVSDTTSSLTMYKR